MTDKKTKLVTLHVKGRKPEKMTTAEAAKRMDAANGIKSKSETDSKKNKSER